MCCNNFMYVSYIFLYYYFVLYENFVINNNNNNKKKFMFIIWMMILTSVYNSLCPNFALVIKTSHYILYWIKKKNCLIVRYLNRMDYILICSVKYFRTNKSEMCCNNFTYVSQIFLIYYFVLYENFIINNINNKMLLIMFIKIGWNSVL